MTPSHSLPLSLILTLALLVTGAHGTVMTVHNGERIQTALNIASPGDIVIVEAGTYPERILINKSLTLFGDNSAVIDAQNVLNADAVTITADGVRIDGFTVINSSRVGINISANDTWILRTDLAQHTHSGIAVRSVQRTVIADTTCRDSAHVRIGYGIYLSQAGEVLITNVTIMNTNASGIYEYRSSNVTIVNATITATRSQGIFIRMSDKASVYTSTITDNGNGATTYGMIVENSPGTRIIQNRIHDNRCTAIRISYSNGSIVSGNNINGATVRSVCTGTGIFLEETSSATIEGNVINDHHTGLQLISSPGTSVYQNIFRSTTQPVSVLASSATWHSPSPLIYTYQESAFTNATGNSWEGYGGTDTSSDGIGDTPYTVTGSQQDLFPLVGEISSYQFPEDRYRIDGCILLSRQEFFLESGSPTDPIVARILINDVTQHAGATENLTVEVGYGEYGVSPDHWTRWTAPFFSRDNGTSDEYSVHLTLLTPGSYHIAARANRFDGPFYYCSITGIQSGSLVSNLGNLTVIDTTPPPCITDLVTTTCLPTSITWVWNLPSSPDLDHLPVYLNGTLLDNLSPSVTTYTATHLAPSTPYHVAIECIDGAGNVNTTRVNHTASTSPLSDTIPPASVQNLRSTLIHPDALTWRWEDPVDSDFSHIIVYLDGFHVTNVTAGAEQYSATLLAPSTRYTLGLVTVDTNGNVNMTIVNTTTSTSRHPDDCCDGSDGGDPVPGTTNVVLSPTPSPLPMVPQEVFLTDPPRTQPPIPQLITPDLSSVTDLSTLRPASTPLSPTYTLVSLAVAMLITLTRRKNQ